MKRAQSDFGDVTFSWNTNSVARGENNVGSVSGNSNINITSYRSTLVLRNNSNTSVRAENCKLNLNSCSNSTFAGKNYTAVCQNNFNSTIRGDGGEIEAFGNSNTTVSMTNSTVKLISNSNSAIAISDGNVKAVKNSNLTIRGAGENVSVENTTSHTLMAVDGSCNTFEMRTIPGFFHTVCKYKLFGFSWRQEKSSKTFGVSLEHVKEKEVIIKGNTYKVGAFKWVMEKLPTDKFKMKMDASNFDLKYLDVELLSSKELVFRGTKKGELETLKFLSSTISRIDDNDELLYEISV